jgi:GH24 family phage-related lysozyme (muramidase)
MDIRQSAVDRTASFEDFVGYMYVDTTGNVTIGYGHMLPDADSATSIPLKRNGAPATAQQKRNEWTTMHSKEPGHPARYYKQFTTLTLDESDAKSLLKDDLTTAAANLATRFPSLDDYPDAAQDALLDMMFNIGLTKFTKDNWPKLFEAVEAKNWRTAAAQSHRSDVSDDRNDAIRDLFLSAAGMGRDVANAAKIQWLLGQQLSELLKFIAAGQDSSKFYPHGITKIHISIKVAGAEFALQIEGPEHA